jgi:hypothetical protein
MLRRGFVAMMGWGLLGCVSVGSGGGEAPAAQTTSIEGWDGEWSEFRLPGKRATRYSVERAEGPSVLRADADRSASMWRRRLQVGARELGTVSFSWMVPRVIEAADLTDGEFEDSPVRLVLAFDGDRSRLSTRDRAVFELMETLTGEVPPYATLMYVWDPRAEPELVIPGNRSSRIKKIVVDSGAQHLRQWRRHTRSIVEDFRRAFGEDPGPLVGVGLMTDSDNTQSRVRAYYGQVVLRRADGTTL